MLPSVANYALRANWHSLRFAKGFNLSFLSARRALN